jgi:hypothetical protein
LGYRHIPVQPALDFFSLGGCVACSHLSCHCEPRFIGAWQSQT